MKIGPHDFSGFHNILIEISQNIIQICFSEQKENIVIHKLYGILVCADNKETKIAVLYNYVNVM